MAESSKTHHFIPVIIFPSKVTSGISVPRPIICSKVCKSAKKLIVQVELN